MTIFGSFMALVAGLLFVLNYWRSKLTTQEFTTCLGLALLVASSVGLVIGMNEIKDPLQFLSVVAGTGVIWLSFFEWKRCSSDGIHNAD